jgi:REP element-mobilizing transposase RayT
MARKPRIHVPGGFYHVILRGNGGDNIFFTDADRCRFYLLVQEGVERFGHRVHAFCLMNNHVHLLIQIAEIPLSRIMQNLSFRYTRWINKRQRRTGHLFQGRYKAVLVDADSYLLELVRYIHLNPVRAGVVEHIPDYPWSSHAAYVGRERLTWLTSEVVLARFSTRRNIARARYAEFIAQGVGEPCRPDFHGGTNDARVLGDDAFAEKALAEKERLKAELDLEECIETVCRHYDLQASALSERHRTRRPAEARAVVGWLAMKRGGMPLSTVARHFGRDVSTLSTSIRRLEVKMIKSDALRTMVERIADEVIKI